MRHNKASVFISTDQTGKLRLFAPFDGTDTMRLQQVKGGKAERKNGTSIVRKPEILQTSGVL